MNAAVNSFPTVAVVSASAGPASRTAILAGCALAALGDHAALIRRVELARISPAALYERLPSDKMELAVRAVESADVVVVVAPTDRAAFGALLPAFLDAAPGSLVNKTVVPLLAGGDRGVLAGFESWLRRRLESLGARVALGELFDADDDFGSERAAGVLARRVELAIEESLALRGKAFSGAAEPVATDRPVLLAS